MTAKPSSRRNFLQKLTATIGGAATLALTAKTLQAAPQKPVQTLKEPAPEAKGYQRTEHVETYYQRADF